jgi:hypothetical protein
MTTLKKKMQKVKAETEKYFINKKRKINHHAIFGINFIS